MTPEDRTTLSAAREIAFRKEVIGDATLYLGDCREWFAGLPPCFRFDHALTSPPYGEIREYGGHELPDTLSILSALAAHVAPGGVVVWNTADQVIDGSESGLSFRQALHAMDCGLRLHDTMIYCKSGVSFPASNRYHPAFEYMFVFSNGAPRYFNGIKDAANKWKGSLAHGSGRIPNGSTVSKVSLGLARTAIPADGLRRNWWVINPQGDAHYEHPARMPYAMAFDHVATWTAPGEMVLDPFMGSGTTGAACLSQNRKFIGIEIDPGYFDIACRRIEEAYRQPHLFAEPAPVQPSMFGEPE